LNPKDARDIVPFIFPIRREPEHPEAHRRARRTGAMAAMLSSDSAAAVTGQVISVDDDLMV
jgi:enoyl-[acyl-carrier-protein] reductase (NADH)